MCAIKLSMKIRMRSVSGYGKWHLVNPFYKITIRSLKGSLFIFSENFGHIAQNNPHCLGMNYYVNFLGGIGSNGFHIK